MHLSLRTVCVWVCASKKNGAVKTPVPSNPGAVKTPVSSNPGAVNTPVPSNPGAVETPVPSQPRWFQNASGVKTPVPSERPVNHTPPPLQPGVRMCVGVRGVKCAAAVGGMGMDCRNAVTACCARALPMTEGPRTVQQLYSSPCVWDRLRSGCRNLSSVRSYLILSPRELSPTYPMGARVDACPTGTSCTCRHRCRGRGAHGGRGARGDDGRDGDDVMGAWIDEHRLGHLNNGGG